MKETILNCYRECPRTQELHQDFAGYNLEECVQDILDKFEELPDYKFIKVDEDELIGYFATTEINENPILFTFFVRPKFRTKEYLTKFWNKITEEFDGEFLAGIYNTNEPAKKFLRRNSKLEFEIENVKFFKF